MSNLKKCPSIPQRYILVLMCCISLMITTSLKASIVVILHELTYNTKQQFREGNACLREEPATKLNLLIPNQIFKWNDSIQASINTVCFWGELITAVPCGIISDKYGGKWVLATSMLISGITSLLIPYAITYLDATGLIIARFFLGCCVGGIIPAINSLLSHWVPFDERSRSGVIIYSGSQIGYQLGYVIPVYIIQTFQILLPVYYYWGTFSIIWFLFFVGLCYNRPTSHPFIRKSELEYLEDELMDLYDDPKNLKIPWIHFFTSGPLIAYYISLIGASWGITVLKFITPYYYMDMLQFTRHETLIRNTISYTFMMFTTVIPGFICDWMVKEKFLSITMARKCWTTLALVGPAICIVFASYADCNAFLANILFMTALALFGPWYTGMMLNNLDLAPNFSGTIYGIAHSISAIIVCLAKPISRAIVTNNYLFYWRHLFWTTFFILCICAAYVGIAASGKVQDWNDPGFKKETKSMMDFYD